MRRGLRCGPWRGPPVFADGIVTLRRARFRRDHPDLACELGHGQGADLEAPVSSGRADLAIFPVGIGGLPRDLVCTPLTEAANVIAFRSGHPILRLAYPGPLALPDNGWVRPPEGSPLAEDMAVILQALDMHEAETVMSGTSLAAVLGCLSQSDPLTVRHPGRRARCAGVHPRRPGGADRDRRATAATGDPEPAGGGTGLRRPQLRPLREGRAARSRVVMGPGAPKRGQAPCRLLSAGSPSIDR